METAALLIVDNLAEHRAMIADLLGNKYRLVEANTGRSALQALEEQRIDLVITTIFLEPTDGYTLIQNIRSKPAYKKIPIIAITESDSASRKRALQVGADDLIYHPFIGHILNNRIEGLLFDGFDLARYQSAYENNPLPFVLYRAIDRPDTPSYRVMYVNRAARRLFDPPLTEDQIRTDEYPEQRDLILSVLRTGEPLHKVIPDEASEKWLSITMYPEGSGLVAASYFDISNQIHKGVKHARETEQEALRARDTLRDVLQNIPAGVLVFTAEEDDLTLVMANATSCHLLDIDISKTPGADRQTIMSFIHPDDHEKISRIIDKLAVPDSDIKYEFRCFNRTKNEYVWLETHARSKVQPDNKVYIFASFSDITAKQSLEQTQLELRSAEQANRAKVQFLSQLSHDMRTPMNGILGLVSLMRNKTDLNEIRSDLDQIDLSGRFLMNLINDVLDITAIEAGQLKLHEAPVNSAQLMQNILTNAQMLASDKGVQLKVVLPPINLDEWKPILADAGRLEQILINLISNAVKFTPEDGTVTIKMESLKITDEEVVDRYQIIDTGIGMEETFLPYIYDAFSQEGRLPFSHLNGTGLGMSVVRQLVDLMGSTIDVESTVDVGTTVTLEMHYKAYQGNLDEPIPDADASKALAGKRVLLVEDHPLNAAIASKLLEMADAKVDHATDGSLAVGMFMASRDHYYDVILMDLRMPVMNGMDATRAIRGSGKRDAESVPIIAMTADALDDDVKLFEEVSMNGFIAKPIDPDNMYEVIAAHIS